jgi:hypothetical protein
MAYEDEDYQGGTSNTNYGLAQNPLMPMGDPLAYARVGAAPEASVPAIHTQGIQPQQIAQPRPINVPNIPGPRGGGESPNQLQPSQEEPDSTGMNMNSLQGLLQMKGMSDLIAPSAPATGLVPVAGAGAGPGRAPAGVSIAAAAAPYRDMVNSAASQYNVDPGTLTRLIYRESQFDPKAISPAGAKGMGQFMDATAKDEGVDVNDPRSSINGAARYYAKMRQRYNGNDQLALAAYNWGPGNVDSYLKTGRGLKGPIPKETLDYVQAISGRPLAPGGAPAGGPVSQMTPKPPDINDPHFLQKHEEWMKNFGKNTMGQPSSAPPTKNFPTVGPMFGGPSMFTQAEQPFKPYRIAGAIQPPPTSSTAPGFGEAPKAGQMSPQGGPYIQRPDGIYATDGDGKIVGPAVKSISAPDKFDPDNTLDNPKPKTVQNVPGPLKQEVPERKTGFIGSSSSQGGGFVPGATPPVEAPAPAAAPTSTPTEAPATATSVAGGADMQKLWRYMLIKSLFPQMKFRNIGYDPWAVHRFGQGGGY